MTSEKYLNSRIFQEKKINLNIFLSMSDRKTAPVQADLIHIGLIK